MPTLGTTALPDFLDAGLGLLDTNLVRLYLAQMVAVDLPRWRAALRTLVGDARLRERMGARGASAPRGTAGSA